MVLLASASKEASKDESELLFLIDGTIKKEV